MKKSVVYIVLIVLLLATNLFLFFTPKNVRSNQTSGAYLGEYDFTLLESISFTHDDQLVSIKRADDQWLLNDSLKVDEGFFNTLISILERVESTREVRNWEGDIIGGVALEFVGETLSLSYASNATQTKSYFINEGQVHEVAVPGYQDNVIDIFKLHPDQWRDRLVFDGSWRTIQKIDIALRGGGDVEIAFNDKFFTVNGKQPQDSSAVVDYLNQYQYFQANEMISKGRFMALDSLMSTPSMAIITIDDINYENQLSIIIYPRLQNQNYHLALSDNKMMVLDQRRVKNLLELSRLSQSK